VKNLFVAVPLVFARRLDDFPQALRAAAAVGLFCALSSAVYFWNDLIDIEKDRAHPKKKHRPIPSGRLSKNGARAGALILAVGALVGAVFLRVDFALCAAGYLINNAFYSLWWKRVVYLDVLSISAGFLLRVYGGALAIDVWVSTYLLICTGLFSLYFGFGKRTHELAAAGDNAVEQRAVLRSYRRPILIAALWVTGLATLAAYIAYTLSPHTAAFFGTNKMFVTVPFGAFGLGRFGALVMRSDRHESPTDAMLRDWPFVLNLALWTITVVAIIYFHI
jgi:4-hydroxybenzoate polyprenyltransferase